jgi:hypothetical protein
MEPPTLSSDLDWLDPAPDWILELCRNAHGRSAKGESREPVGSIDSEERIARAIEYLEREAPEAVAGDAGDITVFKIAARLREIGVSQAVALDLMLGHWNETKAHPVASAEWLDLKVSNAFRYATEAWGGASGLAEFGGSGLEILEVGKKPADRPRLYRVRFDESVAKATEDPPEPLIEGLIDMHSMVVMYGASNSGKTFVMLDFAFHIAAGLPWQGRRVSRGPVLYIATEGGRGIHKRVAALAKHYQQAGVPLDLVPCPINLLDGRADVPALLQVVDAAQAEHKAPIKAIIIDTLNRALSGGDENASTDMGAFVRNIDKIRAATGAAVLVVHHSGKNQAMGARGHSSLRAATDTEIEIAENTISVTKQRDMDAASAIQFALDRVDVATGADGRPISSCVLHILNGSEFAKMDLSPEAQQMLDALETVLLQKEIDGVENPETVTTKEWNTEFLSLSTGKKGGASAKTLQRLRTEVVTGGHAVRVNNNQWVKAEVDTVDR